MKVDRDNLKVSDEMRAFIDDLEAKTGWMHDFELTLAEKDPDFFKCLAGLLKTVYDQDRTIPIKYRTLMSIALGSARHAPGIPAHVAKALRHGATKREIVEAVEMASIKYGAPAVAYGLNTLAAVAGPEADDPQDT